MLRDLRSALARRGEGLPELAKAPIRIALTIAGAVSLGAYEGGALAALLVAVQAGLRKPAPPIQVDVIGGASAGAITGLMAARALVAGIDPVTMMLAAWVERDDLSMMTSHQPHEPLSMDVLARTAVDVLDRNAAYGQPRQRAPVHIRMALGCLRGLNYEIQGLAPPEAKPVQASTYIDWSTFALPPGPGFGDDYTKEGGLIESALASGATAFGFGPRWLNRSIFDKEYRAANVTNLPASKAMWYTDGGTINNEPIGRTLDLVNEVQRERRFPKRARRLLLLIHPHPEAPLGDDHWAKPKSNPPDWIKTGARAAGMAATHGIYEDLRRAAKTNSRIEWTTELARLIEQNVPPGGAVEFGDALATFIGNTDQTKARLSARKTRPATNRASALTLAERILLAIQLASGLEAKRKVDIEVVSPLILSSTPVEQVLAGAFLMSFGGFLDKDLRLSDFDLGYRSMLKWLETCLPIYASTEDSHAALDAATARYDPSWNKDKGGATFASLAWADKLKALRLGLHVGRVVAGEAISPRQP